MSRLVAQAESWEKTYNAFQNINFAAFDYDTVKRSLLDYIKLYFPETFNDYIESSEFIAIVEAFAYFAELMAYRLDVNAHENFISDAQRQDSILRLAKLVSYTASRPLPARGLVKITSISTTESVTDANGNDLAGQTIRWNDTSNPNWKDQFILVMNRVMDQTFGSVGPTDRFQIQDVVFELYAWDLIPLPTGVFSFSANVGGQNAPMELVPVAYDTSTGIIERRPAINSNFSFLYGQDGLGDASDMTGFFCYTKQGSLQRFRNTFDGITPNQTYNITPQNVNDTDVWFNQVNQTTGETYNDPEIAGKSGEWVQVDSTIAQNVIFNTNAQRNKYEVETLTDSTIRLIFGDGEFADIPSGPFDTWVRTSVNADIVVPSSSISDTSSSFTYLDSFNRVQTCSFTFSLSSSLQNASAAESIEHVRTTAGSVYNTQDRMVNGADYNYYMLQDPSILKLRSINRTFAGDSKYIAWHDASGTYENVKIFSDDGALFYKKRMDVVTTPVVTTDVLINSYIQPLLSTPELYLNIFAVGVDPLNYRRTFNADEINRITDTVTISMPPVQIELYYNTVNNQWYSIKVSDNPSVALAAEGWPNSFITTPLITVYQVNIFETQYNVTRVTQQLIVSSNTTQFWNTNDGSTVIDYDTLNSDQDQIVVLQANVNYNRDGILTDNVAFNVLSLETIESGVDLGLPDTSRVSVLPVDANNDGLPDYISDETVVNPQGIAQIIKPKKVYNVDTGETSLPQPGQSVVLTLPVYVVIDPSIPLTTLEGVTVYQTNDVAVYVGTDDSQLLEQAYDWATSTPTNAFVTNVINVLRNHMNTSYPSDDVDEVLVKVTEYVYFTRETPLDPWVQSPSTPNTMIAFVTEVNSYTNPATNLPLTIADADSESVASFENTRVWKRYEGRGQLNFAWFHHSPQYYLVDPSPTNIIDTFIITKGYYALLKQWLEDPLATQPIAPTPLDLRTSYNYLLDNKMISDTVILQPGSFKLLFGSKAIASLQADFLVIRSSDRTLTDNQIKTTIVTAVRNFFDVTLWEFGESFYFSELSAAIHKALPTEINSVILVPTYAQDQFGDLYQVIGRENEVFYPDITVDDIQIVASYTPTNMRLNG